MYRLLLLAALAGSLSPGSVHARRLESWPYDQLLEKADLVVIATAVTGKDSGEISRDNLWKSKFVGVNTNFSVKAVLKGKAGDKLTVFHYRLPAGTLIEDGPLLVAFRTKGIKNTTKESNIQMGKPSYLLFLKKRKDGRFELVSGQVDPALAVREMHQPLPEKSGKAD
jgi:hypothetical protein